jgi:hypothetical protein
MIIEYLVLSFMAGFATGFIIERLRIEQFRKYKGKRK